MLCLFVCLLACLFVCLLLPEGGCVCHACLACFGQAFSALLFKQLRAITNGQARGQIRGERSSFLYKHGACVTEGCVRFGGNCHSGYKTSSPVSCGKTCFEARHSHDELWSAEFSGAANCWACDPEPAESISTAATCRAVSWPVVPKARIAVVPKNAQGIQSSSECLRYWGNV